MSESTQVSTVFSDSKPHYEILDALRGVAAVTVVIFHLFEALSGGDHVKQIINHGYLAVDFFFCLSGFVVGHAYDDRWKSMSLGQFFRRRLIRLHPMILFAMAFGAVCFYFSASPTLFPKIDATPVWHVILTMLVGMTLIPITKTYDIRGWEEMHPLNGPAWTLFFEYVANIFYALILRRLPTIVIAVLAGAAAYATVDLAVYGPAGDVVGGWSLDPAQLKIGFTRLAYPFLAGYFLSRIGRPKKRLPAAFLVCSAMILVVLAYPRVGDKESLWMNGIYDSAAIIFAFPLIVWLGAAGELADGKVRKVARWLGDISYPLYIVHYPLIYIYTAWVVDAGDAMTPGKLAGVMALVLVSSLSVALFALKAWDIPVRHWLTSRMKEAEQS